MLALSTPSRSVLSKYDLSLSNLFISDEIGWILSTRTSDNFSLNSEKFLPAKISTLFSKVEFVKLEYIPKRFFASNLLSKSFKVLGLAMGLFLLF